MNNCSKLLNRVKVLVIFAALIYFPIITGTLWYLGIGLWSDPLNTSFFKIWAMGFFILIAATLVIASPILIVSSLFDKINKQEK